MSTPKKPPSKTESAIQLGNMYRFMARGSGRKLKKIGEKPSKVSKTKKIGEVQTRPKKSLQNQKPDKSPKSSDWDAHVYNQKDRIGHGKPMGSRAARDLAKKHPKTYTTKRKIAAKKLQSLKFKIQPKPTKKK